MRTLFIGFALLAVLTSAHSQPVWESENGPYGGTFIDIIAHGDSLVAAPYYRPFLLIGNAEGWKWRQVDMPSPAAEPFSILSPGEGRLLVGSFGRIYRSDDNGETWNERYLPDMQGEIVDELTGEGDTLFACGGGLLYRSLDRGFSWQLQEGAPEVFTVKVFKEHVVVGGPVGIHLSSDHGSSWDKAPFAADTIDGLLVAADYLFAVLRSPLAADTLRQLLYRSTNSEKWMGTGIQQRISTITGSEVELLAGVQEKGERITFYKSNDGGLSWRGSDPEANRQLPRDIWSLYGPSHSLLVSLGGLGLWKYYGSENLWEPVSVGYFSVGVAKLGFDNEGMYAYSMKENFVAMPISTSHHWHRVPYFTDGERPGDMLVDSNGVMLGVRGGVLRSTDLGSSWKQYEIPYPDATVQALTMVGERMIAGVANHGAVYSDDIASLWQTTVLDGPAQWFGFASHGTDVWAATTDGLLRSTDTGETWDTFGPSGSCYAVAVWDENTVITASESGIHALDARSSVSTAMWTVSAGYSLHVLPDGGGICAATQDSGIVFFQYPGAAPMVLGEGLPAVGFAPPTVCRIALDSHDGRLYFGNCGLPGLWSLDLSSIPVAVRETPSLPAGMTLSPAYPNPSDAVLSVDLELGGEEYVEITLVDRLGRVMRNVHHGVRRPGRHAVSVDVRDLPAGLYFCVARAGGRISTVPVSVLH